MRRLSVLATVLVFGAVLTASAFGRAADRPSEGPGLLGVDGGQGSVVVTAGRGGIVGQIDQGRLTVTLRKPSSDAGNVLVSGAQTSFIRAEKTTVYVGKDLHFRI